MAHQWFLASVCYISGWQFSITVTRQVISEVATLWLRMWASELSSNTTRLSRRVMSLGQTSDAFLTRRTRQHAWCIIRLVIIGSYHETLCVILSETRVQAASGICPLSHARAGAGGE